MATITQLVIQNVSQSGLIISHRGLNQSVRFRLIIFSWKFTDVHSKLSQEPKVSSYAETRSFTLYNLKQLDPDASSATIVKLNKPLVRA